MSTLVVLENADLKVVISPFVGGSIVSFQYNLNGEWVDVMRPTSQEAVEGGEAGLFSSFTMIPFSNRIAEGVLSFQGTQYSLDINPEVGHTIHGDVRSRPWKIAKQSASSLEICFDSNEYPAINWPWSFSATVEYVLDGKEFITRMSVKNTDAHPMPAGMGIHPYFVRKLAANDEKVAVQLPTTGVYPGETQIPTGGWIAVPSELDFSAEKLLTADYLDKCFFTAQTAASIRWVSSGVQLNMDWDPVFQHLIIYCPLDDHDVFAVEPVTNCNNAFNLAAAGVEQTGMVVLQTDQVLTGDVRLTIRRDC